MKRSKENIKKELVTVLNRMKRLCKSYDNGNIDDAVLLATQIRVLVHNTKRSKSLISQLNDNNVLNKKVEFFTDYSGNFDDVLDRTQGNYVRSSLIQYQINHKEDYDDINVCPIVKNPFENHYCIPINEWWSERSVLFLPSIDHSRLTRKEVVLLLSDKGGGAHVDLDIPHYLYQLQENLMDSLKLNFSGNADFKQVDTSYVLEAITRAIASEILSVFVL